MSVLLVGTGLALGFAASPHCMLMCASPCALVTGGSRKNAAAFHVARIAGYAVAGAIVAAGALSLFSIGGFAPWLRPLWMLAQLALGIVGVYWLVTGRGFRVRREPSNIVVGPRRRSTVATMAAGASWVALPCGVLQGALVVATLASSAAAGAAFMGAFALASAPAIGSAGVLMRAREHLPAWVSARLSTTTAVRLAGLGVVCATAFAVGHGVWERVAEICAT